MAIPPTAVTGAPAPCRFQAMYPGWIISTVLTMAGIVALAGPGRGAEGLGLAFDRAHRDPAAVCDLIMLGSRILPRLSASAGAALGDRLQPYCQRVFFGPDRLPAMDRLGAREHVIASGEYPSAIARRYHCRAGMLARWNRDFAPRHLVVGARLKVIDMAKAVLQIVVSRSRYRLLLWRDGTLMGCFPVGLGRMDHLTPVGMTRVERAVKNPEWRDPDTGIIHPPQDPGNVLGGYWLGFDPGPAGVFRGIGMHGYTGAPSGDWIGQEDSHGCIRLRQRDVGEIYDLVLPGTTVTVVP